MTDIEHLISINIELEGLLRVLAQRDSNEARAMLLEKTRAYAALVENLAAATEPIAVPVIPVDDRKLEEVKIQEPVDAEVRPEAEQAEEAIVLGHDDEQVKIQEAAEAETEPEDQSAEQTVETETYTVPEPAEVPAENNAGLLKAFTLNDRFRFRRELFGGDDADFSDTLHLLADMESYKEAEDYLINDMMWSKDNAAVADFLALLQQNMSDGRR